MTDAGASAIFAGASAAILGALGVDPFTIAMATVGAVMLHAYSMHTVGKIRAILQVLSAGIVGALLAQVVFESVLPNGVASRAMLMLMAAFFGFAAFRLLDELASRAHGVVSAILEKLGVKK